MRVSDDAREASRDESTSRRNSQGNLLVVLTVGSLFLINGEMRVKWFEVRDRQLSQQYKSGMPWAAISISSVSDWPSLQPCNRAALLQLKFNDCKNSSEYERGFLYGGIFSLSHAKQILSFAERHWNYVDSFLFQCEDGQCCAPAVAAALMYIYYGPKADDWYFENMNPNIFVYRTILREHYNWLV